jgi:hypothetical protein
LGGSVPDNGERLPIPRTCLRVLKIISGFLKRSFVKKCQRDQDNGLRL